MTEQIEAETAEGGTPRRVDIELFIVYPTWEPTDISTALGLDAHFAHRVGEPRKTRRALSSREITTTCDGDTASGAPSWINGMPRR